jgi:hypothetical protein
VIDLTQLRAAIEFSWDARTSYLGAVRPGNPAYGQCYPTARVVQHFFPEFEIACGDVRTPDGTECHFWNVRTSGDVVEHIDLSWRQFPPGSEKLGFKLLDREALGDSPPTVARVDLLLQRVLAALAR